MGKGDRRPPEAPETGAGDAELFREAVAGAAPLRDDRGFVPRTSRASPRVQARTPTPGTPASAFDLDEVGERIGGSVPDLDQRTRRRLRRGEIAVEARLDLHGLRQAEAEAALTRFVRAEQERGRRCVLVVHGRGLNSGEGGPVLKEGAVRWLTHGAVGRCVLAFCSALPRDGGVGALYVLLRRAGKV
ncbi:MAG: Smr/MutS family protein [Myxococcales bacterium]